MSRPTTRRFATRAVPVAAALAMGLALTACGSGSPTTTTTTSTPIGPTTTTTTTTIQGSGTGPIATRINAMLRLTSASQSLTYGATYLLSDKEGTQTVKVSQQPPKSMLSQSGNGLVVATGTATYFCGSNKQCVTTSLTGSPLSGVWYLFTGQTFEQQVRQFAISAAGLRILGIKVTFFDKTFAGQPATCVTASPKLSNKGATQVSWCVTHKGVLAYYGAGSTAFKMTAYTDTPPASDFTVPPGYRVVN